MAALLAARADIPEPRQVAQSGGRVAWYQGSKHELIAYDALSDKRRGNTELYTMSPDGSGRRCVTCNGQIPQGFVGQPAWYPDGEHIIIQVENANSVHRFYNHMSWGFDNDLWLINRDGSGARKIWSTPNGYAALHPHFNKDGTMLEFAERVPTGKVIPGMRLISPGGENQWDGWRIHLASVNIKAEGADVLANHRTLAPNGGGMYETHGFTDEERLIYSHTAGGRAYVDDIFTANRDGSGVKNLTNSPTSWEEHGQFSSRGDLAFISSRFDKGLRFPRSRPAQLRTELYVQKPGGSPMQITDMNARKGRKIAVSDFDWDHTGGRIICQVAELDGSTNPELWMIDVK
jgi:Tol biopolymer transport system component